MVRHHRKIKIGATSPLTLKIKLKTETVKMTKRKYENAIKRVKEADVREQDEKAKKVFEIGWELGIDRKQIHEDLYQATGLIFDQFLGLRR